MECNSCVIYHGANLANNEIDDVQAFFWKEMLL